MTPLPVVDTLRGWLSACEIGNGRRCLVAFSGGPDSTVLLHALASLRAEFPALRLTALHLDHALHPASPHWANHCRALCRRLDVGLHVHRLAALDTAGGVEAAAREARYAWFSTHVNTGDVLVTAHHRADQAETLLYNLVRGAGVRGLAAMPVERPFAGGTLARPLLSLTRQDLLEYGRSHRLEWIDDPANEGLDHDRNFIRHRLVPAILERWPGAERNLARAAINAGEAAGILDRLAERGVHACRVDDAFNPLSTAPVLNTAALGDLPADECLNLLRWWMIEAGYPPPSRQRLRRLHRDLLADPRVSTGSFAWAGVSIRRYRDAIYLVPPLPAAMPGPTVWRVPEPFDVPGLPLSLSARRGRGDGIALPPGRVSLTVDFATADRSIRLRPGGPRRSLRKVFQEAGVPPWLRRVLPRVSLDGELLCVPGVVQSGSHRAGGGRPALSIELVSRRPPDARCNGARR